jgi:hypothetical protein
MVMGWAYAKEVKRINRLPGIGSAWIFSPLGGEWNQKIWLQTYVSTIQGYFLLVARECSGLKYSCYYKYS